MYRWGDRKLDQLSGLRWKQERGDESYLLLRDIIRTEKNVRVEDNSWDLFLPSSAHLADRYIPQPSIGGKNRFIGVISGNYMLGNRAELWRGLVNRYGTSANSLMPESFLYPEQKETLIQRWQGSYVAKSEVQRQQGILLMDEPGQLLIPNNNQDWSVVQRLLHPPYLYRGKKINLRVYFVIVQQWGKLSLYRYPNGIVSYAGTDYTGKGLMEEEVASFYSSKRLYDRGYPVTSFELMKHDQSFKNVYLEVDRVLTKTFYAFEDRLGKQVSNQYHTSFQLFGADFFVNQYMTDVRLLEINVAPGMTPYLDEDERMREGVFKGLMDLLRVGGHRWANDNLFVRLV